MKLKHKNLVVFAIAVILTAGIGSFVYIYEIPPLIYNGWEQGFVQKGAGGGPIPINTLYTEPNLLNPNSTKPNRLVAGGDPGLLHRRCARSQQVTRDSERTGHG